MYWTNKEREVQENVIFTGFVLIMKKKEVEESNASYFL